MIPSEQQNPSFIVQQPHLIHSFAHSSFLF